MTASPNSLTAEQIQQLTEQMGQGDGSGKGMSKEKLNELLKHISSGAPSTPAAP